jgi:hypothetical protein
MRFLISVVVVFGLIALSFGETAKEAHDKSVDCAKKCARHPSTLRCELQCEQEHQKQQKHLKPHGRKSQKTQQTQKAPKKETKKQKEEVKKVHPKILSRERTIKGRRVFLIRKH